MTLTKEQKQQIHSIISAHVQKMAMEYANAYGGTDPKKTAFYEQKRTEAEALLPIFAGKAPVDVVEDEEEEVEDEEEPE